MYAPGANTPYAVCDQTPMIKWITIINGIIFIVFYDKYSFAGILIEYLRITCFLHIKFKIIPIVIIGSNNGMKEEYMIVINI